MKKSLNNKEAILLKDKIKDIAAAHEVPVDSVMLYLSDNVIYVVKYDEGANSTFTKLEQIDILDKKPNILKFNFEYWNWINGQYSQTVGDNFIEIRCFSTREAQKNCGELIINRNRIIKGIDLNAKNYEEGSILLLIYALENNLCAN